jgi:hypothetical protein
MCLLLGIVEIARLYVDGAVRAMSLWHWNDSIILVGASIDDILTVSASVVCDVLLS